MLEKTTTSVCIVCRLLTSACERTKTSAGYAASSRRKEGGGIYQMDRVVSLLCIFRIGGSVLCATATRQREKKWQLERKEDVVMAQRTIFGVGMEESLWERSDGAKASTPRRLDCLYIYIQYTTFIYIYIYTTHYILRRLLSRYYFVCFLPRFYEPSIDVFLAFT